MPALYVIRHAQPAIGGVLLGQSDPPLSEIGEQQATALAGSVPDCAVYSSPLRRAIQTAHFLCSTPIILHDLAEITYGEWDGLPWVEIERKWPDIAKKKLNDWERQTSPGGESWDTFHARVSRALHRIANGSLPAAVVAHEAVNAVIGSVLAGSAIQSYKQKHCEILQYDLRSRA
jgi:broad specificity phosphatase PhoE